jgi:hypothetical protein
MKLLRFPLWKQKKGFPKGRTHSWFAAKLEIDGVCVWHMRLISCAAYVVCFVSSFDLHVWKRKLPLKDRLDEILDVRHKAGCKLLSNFCFVAALQTSFTVFHSFAFPCFAKITRWPHTLLCMPLVASVWSCFRRKICLSGYVTSVLRWARLDWSCLEPTNPDYCFRFRFPHAFSAAFVSLRCASKELPVSKILIFKILGSAGLGWAELGEDEKETRTETSTEQKW